MGAWGAGPWENDGALDLRAEIEDGGLVVEDLAWAFEDEYLEVDGGQIALALVDLALAVRGLRPAPGDLDLGRVAPVFTPEVVAWIAEQADRTLAGTETSEAYELWEEAGSLDEWRLPAVAALAELRASTPAP